MPTLLGDSSDVLAAETLYWKAVSFLVRQPDREEHACELTVRILSGINRTNHNSRVLRIHLSSEDDLFLLHSLEVSEEDFQALKAEQGILVDFGSFPAKVISLLERCVQAQAEHPPRFQAMLGVREGSSLFRVVETTDFNQLPHITLAFRPGNDGAVKAFLASRLGEVKGAHARLEAALCRTQEERDAAAGQLRDAQQQLAEAHAAHERLQLQAQADARSAEAAALAQRLRELAQQKDALDRARAEAEERLGRQVAALQARCADAEADCTALREARHGAEAAAADTTRRLATAEGSAAALDAEVARLREQVASLGAERGAREAELAELRGRLRSSDEKVAAQQELLAEQGGRLRDLEAAAAQLRERCGELKQAAGTAEARGAEAGAEVLKGNRIIEKLTAELRLARERGRRKGAVLQRQEEELGARERALEAAQIDAAALHHALAQARAEAAQHQGEAEELRAKLVDSRQQVQGHEQMIRWLNNQVNEVQLHGATSGKFSGFAPARLPAPSPPLMIPALYSCGAAAKLPIRANGTAAAGAAAKSSQKSDSAGDVFDDMLSMHGSEPKLALPSLAPPASLPLPAGQQGRKPAPAASAAPPGCKALKKAYTGSVQFHSAAGRCLAQQQN